MWLAPLLVLAWITKINSNKWQIGPCSLHFATYNSFSMCLAVHLTCCPWRENTWMVYCYCLPLSTPGKGFFNKLASSVASYHARLWVCITHDITTIFLWSFFTIKLQARVLTTTVGFTKHLAETLVLFTHNLLWVPARFTPFTQNILRVDVSFLLSMRLTTLC
jgi:hypothetical protein